MAFPVEPPNGSRIVTISPRLGERVWKRDDAAAHHLGDPSTRWYCDDYKYDASWQALVVCSTSMYRLVPLDLT
jgi:hypothetical protein